jgi:hypothetical protein
MIWTKHTSAHFFLCHMHTSLILFFTHAPCTSLSVLHIIYLSLSLSLSLYHTHTHKSGRIFLPSSGHSGICINSVSLYGSCRTFAHISEYNPASIKFKIQLSAYYHIPEIKLLRFPAKESLIPGKSVDFMIKIINPTQHPTFIEILDLVC